MGFLDSALEEGGGWLGRQAGKALGKILPFKRGTKKTAVAMKRGGKAKPAHMVKGSKAAKAHMAKLRAMRG